MSCAKCTLVTSVSPRPLVHRLRTRLIHWMIMLAVYCQTFWLDFKHTSFNLFPRGYELLIHESLCSRFAKISACLRLVICKNNTKPIRVKAIKTIMKVYLLSVQKLLNSHSQLHNNNSLHDSFEPLLRSLEDMALQNIQTRQSDIRMEKNSSLAEMWVRSFMETNRDYLQEIYHARKKYALGAADSALRVVPIIFGCFLGKDETVLELDTRMHQGHMPMDAHTTLQWLTILLKDHDISDKADRLHLTVAHLCQSH